MQDLVSLHEIRYTPKVKFTGKSGYDHMFDFVTPKSKLHTERILQTINSPNRSAAETLAFKWVDTSNVRSPGTNGIKYEKNWPHDRKVRVPLLSTGCLFDPENIYIIIFQESLYPL
jgi:hypothetical protein